MPELILSIEDALNLLGVARSADPDQLRAAYLMKVREFPPDRNPEKFEKIRDAYQLLHDPRSRATRIVREGNPMEPFVSLIEGEENRRRHIGPEAWIEMMK